MSSSVPKIFVIGGTGAQGIPIVRGLVEDGKYQVRVLTRDITSKRAQDLQALGNVELVVGSFANESRLRAGFRGCAGAYVNIDGFTTGEKGEMFWAMRAYELAIDEGVKFFVYGNLDYGTKKGGYDAKYRTGHYDGKGRVGEWMLWQNRENRGRMGAAVFTSGPYIEMAIAYGTPMMPTMEDGVLTWRLPLGDGAVPHVSLDDCAHYVRWLFDNQERANGMDLEVAIDHIQYEDVAAAFEKVSGHPAQFIDISLEEYWKTSPFGGDGAQLSSAIHADPKDPASLTRQQTFTGFWNLFRDSGNNTGVIRRDYQLLDEIHPNRIRTVEEYFRREQEKGEKEGLGSLWDRVQPARMKPVLKLAEDGARLGF
ncbi:NmrA family protein [Eremomyces bilateralis CBS 781.70]|uniref:NmrA family protein n=1 Tax=Eremomyces bilateralis CBS 781.70 TaxID=1392243 RepID=A0A6G1GC36_9PEZI|nr:NmrA family protein [Eremomyces bilateralis CBS 781.70]KAF1815496.1 NmrA family protein [Eremomyces bilateralis CBS 781.70]